MSGALVYFDSNGPMDFGSRVDLACYVNLANGGERLSVTRLPGWKKGVGVGITPAEASAKLRALADWIEAQDAAPQHSSS